MLKYVLMVGVATAIMSVAPPAFAKAKPFGCTRTLVNLSPAVSVIYSDCKLKWWGAHFVPGDANGGGSSWVEPSEPPKNPCYKPPRCPPPCYTHTIRTTQG
jgi:hypothetical protein